ncbi:MAG: hypothetical protein SXV54_20125 [Chloroflexota bacterium]|nr:hypothetical protein [Chloroflexota bacterium]
MTLPSRRSLWPSCPIYPGRYSSPSHCAQEQPDPGGTLRPAGISYCALFSRSSFTQALRTQADDAPDLLLFGPEDVVWIVKPGQDIRNVVDSTIFASSQIGSVIPMLFTSVPGSALYEGYRGYLDEIGF